MKRLAMLCVLMSLAGCAHIVSLRDYGAHVCANSNDSVAELARLWAYTLGGDAPEVSAAEFVDLVKVTDYRVGVALDAAVPRVRELADVRALAGGCLAGAE